MNKAVLNDFYGFVASQPCESCGRTPVQVAHIEGLAHGTVPGTGYYPPFAPRSHTTEAAFCCIPLCDECHQQLHKIGERKYEDIKGWPYRYLIGLALKNLVAYVNTLDLVVDVPKEK